MSKQPNSARWIKLLLSCIIAIGGGSAILLNSPLGRRFIASHRLGDSSSDTSRRSAATNHPMSTSQSMGEFDAQTGSSSTPSPHDHDWGRYDNIVVEVRPDGSLRVLGEPMGVEAFKTLLDAQLHEQLRTMVTIRPDNECLFRHVGSVIKACQEVGVPHQMEPRPVTVPAIATFPASTS